MTPTTIASQFRRFVTVLRALRGCLADQEPGWPARRVGRRLSRVGGERFVVSPSLTGVSVGVRVMK
jgi:hypothetical protein